MTEVTIGKYWIIKSVLTKFDWLKVDSAGGTGMSFDAKLFMHHIVN